MTDPADPSTPPLFALFNEIGIVEQLSRTLFQARLPHGANVPQFSVLNNLIRVRDGATPLDLARAFQVPKTSMTHTLAGLVQRGWVEMRPNPADARSKQVWITPAGRAFRDEAIARLEPDIARLEADLPGLADELLPGMRRLRAYLDAARDPVQAPE